MDSLSLDNSSSAFTNEEKTFKPYNYQVEIFQRIVQRWEENGRRKNQFGNIVFLETGMGKTHIAIMLLNYLFNNERYQNEFLDGQSEIILSNKNIQSPVKEPLRDKDVSSSGTAKKVFFIVPLQNLIEQQALKIEAHTNLKVGRYHGKQKQNKCYKDYHSWQEQFESHDIFVAMARKFYDLLLHGFVKISDLSMLVFDECHHADQEHLYNLIMRDFFYHNFDDNDVSIKRPHILGLTASPIKQKISNDTKMFNQEIYGKLQILSNNLYSRFVTVSPDFITSWEQSLKTSIQQYESSFEENLNAIQEIERQVISPIANLVDLPIGSYDISEIEKLRSLHSNPEQKEAYLHAILNSVNLDIAKAEQNDVVTRFLQGRKTLIQLNQEITKNCLDLQKLKNSEDRILIIMCLMMLKKINSLLLELGPLAVKAYLMDLKHELLKRGEDAWLKGSKCDKTVQIIDNYCKSGHMSKGSTFSIERAESLNNKVTTLWSILKKSHLPDQNFKTIVFVKERSVAVYLKKILEGDVLRFLRHPRDQESAATLDDSIICEGLLDRKKFRIDIAMGHSRQNLVSQVLKSSCLRNMDKYSDVIDSIPKFNKIAMTQNKLRENINAFRTGQINILIATNVVEEGLDVSTCNQVICLNELTTVKAFIQMKGRARQSNSKFIFLCSAEEAKDVEVEQKNFNEVIQVMKKIALQRDEDLPSNLLSIPTAVKEISPLHEICRIKVQDPNSYHEESITGARISMRDAKQLLETFCLICAESSIKYNKSSHSLTASSQSTLEANSSAETNLAASDQVRPKYVVKDESKGELKFFFCVLYMPECCKDKLRKVNPVNAYLKKRDAENHVALLAVIKLRKRGYFDERLFPVEHLVEGASLDSDRNLVSSSMSVQSLVSQASLRFNESRASIGPASLINALSFDPTQPRKRKQISDEEKLKEHQSSKLFQQQIKNEKPNVEKQPGACLLNKVRFKQDSFKDLKILVFRGRTPDDVFPYRTSKDFIGILYERDDFCSPPLSFLMYQETKQREKNAEHLSNLLRKRLITEEQAAAAEQEGEELEVKIDSEDSFYFWDDLQEQGLSKGKGDSCARWLTKLQFFHIWIFYYLYSADHKFLKAIFKNKFSFVQHLFRKDIEKVRQKYEQTLRFVYGEKCANMRARPSGEKFGRREPEAHCCYSVPLFWDTRAHKFRLNWALIEKVLDYVRGQIQDFRMPTERHLLVSRYDLEEYCKKSPERMVRRVWDNKFQGIRHVVLDSDGALAAWQKNLELLQAKKDERSQFKSRLKLELEQLHLRSTHPRALRGSQFDQGRSYLKQSYDMGSESFDIIKIQSNSSFLSASNYTICKDARDVEKKQINFNPQEYYFIKQGQLQIRRFNRQMHKCRKERHFIDFGKKRKDELTDLNSSQQQPLVLQGTRKTNTKFDLTEQMLSLAPVSYDQYQVLQQTCYHVLNLNEFLLFEEFIIKFFSSPELQTCLLMNHDQIEKSQLPADLSAYVPNPKYSTKLFLTKKQVLEHAGSELIEVSTAKHLQCKLALIREALTGPSACRDYDYERLEFYGDSIIGFLVILEIFLTNQNNQEGDLDFLRIKRVSNKNFFQINEAKRFYDYMITDPHHVFSGFLPTGFDPELNYQNKVTQKTYNELNNKFKEFKKVQMKQKLLKVPNDDLCQMSQSASFYTLAKIILKDFSFVKKIKEAIEKSQVTTEKRQKIPRERSQVASKGERFKKLFGHRDQTSVLLACKLMFEAELTPHKIQMLCSDVCNTKIHSQVEKQKADRDRRTADNTKQNLNKKRQFYYKQYADVVESISGAVTIACGINFTMDFLRSLSILKVGQDVLQQKLSELCVEQEQMEARLTEHFYLPYEMCKVENILSYSFKCKSYIVQALTHKSFIDIQSESKVKMRLEDYERLEFLGDSVLNYLVAKYFFESTQNDVERKMPKELHRMKTSIINNVLLGLIVIENDIQNYIVYNTKAASFKQQVEHFVKSVKDMLLEKGATSVLARGEDLTDDMQALDLDEVHNTHMKMFGDVFESLIGAVFMDCRDIDLTWKVLKEMINPYIVVYADLQTMQDHSRTKLLELWNQYPYTKRLKITHESKQIPEKDQIKLTALVLGYNRHDRWEILSELYPKDHKNKVRSFYKHLYEIVQQFVTLVEERGDAEETRLMDYPEQVRDGLRKIHNKQKDKENKLKQLQAIRESQRK